MVEVVKKTRRKRRVSLIFSSLIISQFLKHLKTVLIRKERTRYTKSFLSEMPKVVYHLPQIPGNSGWVVNGKRFFGSSHWKIPGTNGNSEKVVPFSRLGRSEWKFVYHLQVSWVSYHFHVVTRIQSSAALQSGIFRQMVNDTYRSYGPKFPEFFYKW